MLEPSFKIIAPRRRIDRLPRRRKVSSQGTGHDNVAHPSSNHVWQDVVNVLHHNVDVEIQHPVNCCRVGVDQIAADVSAGIGMQDVDLPCHRQDARCERRAGLRVEEIHDQRNRRITTFAANLPPVQRRRGRPVLRVRQLPTAHRCWLAQCPTQRRLPRQLCLPILLPCLCPSWLVVVAEIYFLGSTARTESKQSSPIRHYRLAQCSSRLPENRNHFGRFRACRECEALRANLGDVNVHAP